MLRDEGEVAQTMARVLATSRYATDLLEREPTGVRILGADLAPLGSEALTKEMLASAGRQGAPDAKALAIRAIRRRELLRVATGELTGDLDVVRVGAGLTNLTDAPLEATLSVAPPSGVAQRKIDEPPSRPEGRRVGKEGVSRVKTG